MMLSVILTIENDDDRDFMLNLYYGYNRLMFSKARAVLGENSAEDAVQETIEHLIKKLELLKELDEPRRAAYIAKATQNAAVTILRKKKPLCVNSELMTDMADPLLDVEGQVIQSLRRSSLRTIWPLLSERNRNILTMKYIFRLHDREIGEELGIKQNSVRTTVDRARDEALKLMKEKAGQWI